MRKFKHKPTGKTFSEGEQYYFDSESAMYKSVPKWIVETSFSNDWEEIKYSDRESYWMEYAVEIPPGIISFKDKNGIIKFNGQPYADWVRDEFKNGSAVHSISRSDNYYEQTVGYNVYQMGVISKLDWDNGKWYAYFDGDHVRYSIISIPKGTPIPERKPVVTLQGKDLFEGDEFWYISMPDWVVLKDKNKVTGNEPKGDPYWRLCFASKELAEQYVRDNKPVYPAGIVDKLIRWWDAVKTDTIIRARNNPIQCENIIPDEIFDKLKKYKNENNLFNSIYSPGIEFYKKNK